MQLLTLPADSRLRRRNARAGWLILGFFGLMACVPAAFAQGGSGRSGGSTTSGGGAARPPAVKPPARPRPPAQAKGTRRGTGGGTGGTTAAKGTGTGGATTGNRTNPDGSGTPATGGTTTAFTSSKPVIDGNSVQIRTSSPLVTFRILFLTGAADDPEGKEGVAALTAAMLARGGSKNLSYDQIVNAFYPMAASFADQTDKEMTVFSGTTHADNLDDYYALVRQMLLEPGFREDDFVRLKDEAINFLKTSLREGNDEELGKEQLYLNIYGPRHPYGHHNVGTLSTLEKLTLQDVRDFYQNHYTEANLTIGLAGGYPANLPAKIKSDFGKLPAGTTARRAPIPAPELEPGLKIEIIKRETRSTAISLGFPISITRTDRDWPALALITSYFGQHRSSNSHLYQRLREVRGLNYGDYAYLEYFPRGMFQFQPDTNQARQQQIFQIWIRPVEPNTGHFALRAALYEYEKLLRDGLSAEDFAATREFLTKNVNLLVANQSAQLGYALDSRYYNTPDFTEYMRQALKRLTLDETNAALRKYLSTDQMRVVIVTKDADSLRDAITSNRPSPMSYNSPKDAAVLAEDKIIQNYPIKIKRDDVRVRPISQVFQ